MHRPFWDDKYVQKNMGTVFLCIRVGPMGSAPGRIIPRPIWRHGGNPRPSRRRPPSLALPSRRCRWPLPRWRRAYLHKGRGPLAASRGRVGSARAGQCRCRRAWIWRGVDEGSCLQGPIRACWAVVLRWLAAPEPGWPRARWWELVDLRPSWLLYAGAMAPAEGVVIGFFGCLGSDEIGGGRLHSGEVGSEVSGSVLGKGGSRCG
jgi:hypothetical protein